MTIAVEKIEIVGVDVPDVARARNLFATLFGLDFGETVLGADSLTEDVPTRSGAVHTDERSVRGRPTRIAIDRSGLFELVEETRPAMRNIHFKVADIDDAVAQMDEHGIRCVSNHRVRGMREAIFDARDLFGLRLCFVQYDAPTLIDAILGVAPRNRDGEHR